MVVIISGCGDAGIVRRLKGLNGAIRTMTTTRKAGKCTKDIGTMKTTITATGETMIVITNATMATTMIMTITNH